MAWCASTTCARAPHLGDIQVNLVDKHHRDRQSHAIALGLRAPLQEIARKYNGNAKIVEIPPGPPVLSPLVAEVYGLDYEGQIAMARQVRAAFEGTADIVDVDDSVEHPAPSAWWWWTAPRRPCSGCSRRPSPRPWPRVLGGEDMSFLHGANVKYAVPIRVEYAQADKADLEQVLSLRVRSQGGALVPLSEIVRVVDASRAHSIYHKDLLPGGLCHRRHGRAHRQPALWPVRDRRQARRGPGPAPVVRPAARQPLRIQPQMGRGMAGHL